MTPDETRLTEGVYTRARRLFDDGYRSLSRGLRLLSVYALPGGTRVWIITEADRSAATLLLPDEY